ncbi:MAG: type II asparaginase [Thermoanaerobaculales bacterium]|jgi:L-asparaginase|nr:type II asparaginase [Thermoanaerobaculales bacterium]
MNRLPNTPFVILGLAILVAAAAAAEDLPHVVVLATGGTIAGAQPAEGDPGYKAGSLSIDSLIAAAPGMDKIARITGEQIASIGSQDMNDEVWLKLARRANQLLATPEVDGIVVTHGTDTLEETAYFLNLVIKSDKPVVLVGSMRPATSTSPDGPLNLYNAVAVAADPAARGLGVTVVSNDDLFAAREIQKTNTTDLQTFISPNRGQLGEAYYGKVWLFNRPINRHTTSSELSLDGVEALPRVDIVYSHANADGTMVEAAVAAGAKGIVLAGVGDGNATKPMVDALAAAAKKGVVVVRSSRVGSGIVRRNIEVDDDTLGFVASLELNPQKARVLLRLALLETAEPAEIQRMFDEY